MLSTEKMVTTILINANSEIVVVVLEDSDLFF